MTEEELKDLAASVEDLKRAVRRNNPALRVMMSARGWLPLTLSAGLGMGLFCLPAQILVAAYGSFEAIPAVYRAALWSILALVLVLSGVWKMALIARKAAQIEEGAGVAMVLKALFAGPSFHIGVPYVLTIATLSAFAVLTGHPWFVVPAIAIPTCFWANSVGTMIGQPVFTVTGWWSLAAGLSGLFYVEKAPFLALFVTFGGICLVFAAVIIVVDRRQRPESR